MKKLMFAVAALAAGVACAEITSANIVGYQTYANEIGVNNITAAFTPMNLAKKWTVDVKVFDTEAVGGDTMMLLNMDIFDLDSFVFFGYDGEGKSAGWAYNTSDLVTGDPIQETVASFEVAPGDVTYTQPGDGIPGFTVAGQVADVKGAQVVIPDSMPVDFSNPYPKATTLGDIEAFAKAGDTLMVLNFEIFDLDAYVYLGNGKWVYNTTDMMTGDPISETIEDSTKVVLLAGQGGYFQAADDDGRTWNVAL